MCPTVEALQKLEDKGYYDLTISLEEWQELLNRLRSLNQEPPRWGADYERKR